jgi:deoxyribodipyrimidine photo-lyase
MNETFAPTIAAARARIAAVRPAAYARTRNALDGAVSGLSPYITHGIVSLADVLAGVNARHPLDIQHKFVFELGWRAYFRHVWQHRGEAIFGSLHDGLLPDDAYLPTLPDDIRQACTGVAVIDQSVRTLYDTGMLHNHARMWLASYLVHVRKVHWRAGADWLYAHLLDGDLASNHLSWQWVAGTGSSKPYLFNADNVARYAPPSWHSPNTVIDTSYEALDRLARQRPSNDDRRRLQSVPEAAGSREPVVSATPRGPICVTAPDDAIVRGKNVWLVHPWNLGGLPHELPSDTVVIGLFVADFHRAWPWSERRWQFVGERMAELATHCWYGEAGDIGGALSSAHSVRSVDEAHLTAWLARWAVCSKPAALFPEVERPCSSFSQWWTRTCRGLSSATDLLNLNPPAHPAA